MGLFMTMLVAFLLSDRAKGGEPNTHSLRTSGSTRMLAKWLIGTWKLESFTSEDDEGNITEAMGEGATGFLCYSIDGWVSVQIMKPGRPKFDISDVDGGTTEQTLAAARGFFTYGGTFTVDEERALVYHHLEFSLIPNWIGSRQKRYINIKGEDILELSGDSVLIGGKMQVTKLRWRKL